MNALTRQDTRLVHPVTTENQGFAFLHRKERRTHQKGHVPSQKRTTAQPVSVAITNVWCLYFNTRALNEPLILTLPQSSVATTSSIPLCPWKTLHKRPILTLPKCLLPERTIAIWRNRQLPLPPKKSTVTDVQRKESAVLHPNTELCNVTWEKTRLNRRHEN